MDRKPNTYQVTAICENCGHTPKERTTSGMVIGPLQYDIPKGMMVHKSLYNQTCPNCGCKGSLKRQG